MNPQPPKPLVTVSGLKLEKAKTGFLYGTGCLYELTKWIFVAIIFFTLIHFFVGTIFIVDGRSMEPNFFDGEYLIVNRWQYNFGTPGRGDVVVLKFPGDPEHKKYIKRIIGLPGEKVKIRDGQIFINDKKLTEPYIKSWVQTLPNGDWTLDSENYFMLGDNRPNSSDSRVWGLAPRRYLIGRAWFQIWPKRQEYLSVIY